MGKKEKLMEIARKLFAEKGFYGTPTALIAKEAGISNGMLFHIFTNKEKLIHALYFDYKDRLYEYTQKQVYKGATLKESIYTLWLAALEFNIENPDDFIFLLQFENSPYYSFDIEKEHRYVQLSIELAEQGIEKKIFKDIPPTFLYHTISAQLQVAVKFFRRNEAHIKQSKLVDHFFESAWDSIAIK